ncbi:MAG: hypothetical protein OK442_04815 [Thaumarchaeota archaeon]|nr:hypothetical protein [Nitrososphaerota archaeon]
MAELDVDVELELVAVLEEDCPEDVADDAFVVEEVAEEERGDAWVVVELGETVEDVVLCGEVTTYAAPSKTRAATKAATAACVLLVPALFRSRRPASAAGAQPSRRSP